MKPPKRRTYEAKLEEPDLPEILLPHGLFMTAWKKVDQNAERVKSGLIDLGYCFPKPTLLVNVSMPEWKKLYLFNWLSCHALWISQVDGNLPSKFPSPQMWRDFLNTINLDQLSSTKSASTKIAARDTLGDGIIRSAQGLVGVPEEIVWWGMQVSFHCF